MDDVQKALSPTFVGRSKEMEWLFEHFRDRRGPVVISGLGGIGKTALLQQFLASVRTTRSPQIWKPGYDPREATAELTARIEELYRDQNPPEIVAIDDIDGLSPRELNDITSRILNLKRVRTLIFVGRLVPDIRRGEVLQLGPLSESEANELVRRLLGANLLSNEIPAAVAAAAGSPHALTILAELMLQRDVRGIERLLRGEIYRLDQQIILPERKLITDLKPRIILTNETLVERLRQQPQSIYELPSRKFEELVAELLADLGYEVELTPATRDGGKDILAYMATPHGKILCLVEAKRYRRDRPVGIELVRQLYGTLIDADASSAMIVTTSSFSRDAKTFQQRHPYKLALRDYGDIVQWIEGYGNR